MTGFRPPPERHWRSYGTEPLPPPQEALGLPFRAFPSWFLRFECDRCGRAIMLNARAAARHADPRPPRQDAPRWLQG